MHISVYCSAKVNAMLYLYTKFENIVAVLKGLNIIDLFDVDNLITGPEHPIYSVYYACSMKGLNNFQIAVPSDFEYLHIKVMIFCILPK